METNWLVMRTKSRQENIVRAGLAEKGIICYLPKCRRPSRLKLPEKTAVPPLFPGYIFLKPRSEQFSNLKYIRGSCGLIVFGGKPASIMEKDVESIRIMTENSEEMKIDHEFMPGQRVAVVSGPLRGIEGNLVRIKNVERLVINILIVGQSVSVEIGPSELIKLI